MMIDCVTSMQMLIMQGVQTLPYVALKCLISIALDLFQLYQYALNSKG